MTKDKTPEPVIHQSIIKGAPSPQKVPGHSPLLKAQSPQRPMQSPQRPVQSPQRPMQSPQQSPQISIQSPQHQMQSPQRPLQSPQLQSPQRQIQSPQRQIQSPQRQMPSPQIQQQKSQLPTGTQINLQSPQPPLMSPHRSPFFQHKDGFRSPTIEPFTPVEHDITNHHSGNRQRRASFGLSHPQEPKPDALLLSTRRKSQELNSDLVTPQAPRRNTTEEITSVANLDRPNKPMGVGVVLKDRHPSSLPPPISISLDNALHDKNFQSPMRSVPIPPLQDNLMPMQKKMTSNVNFNDHTSNVEKPTFQCQPNKGPIFDQLHDQLFSKQIKSPPDALLANKIISPEQLVASNRNFLGKGTKITIDPKPSEMLTNFVKGPMPEKQNVTQAPDLGFPQSKILSPEQFSFTKSLQHDLFPPFTKSMVSHDPVFSPPRNHQSEPQFMPTNKAVVPPKDGLLSPKSLSHGYQESVPDLWLNSPPRSTSISQSFVKQPQEVKTSEDPLSHDPLFQVVESNNRLSESPLTSRRDGFPASFFQEPIPSKRPVPDQIKLPPQSAEDDKKRKNRRGKKDVTEEDQAAALAKQRAIDESVKAKLDSIHKALNATTQAKAAAEKQAGMLSIDEKKPADVHDFDNQNSLSKPINQPPHPIVEPQPFFGERDNKTPRGRSRQRGNTTRGRRGRGGRGGMHDNGLRTDPGLVQSQLLTQQQHQLGNLQSQLQPQLPSHLLKSDHTEPQNPYHPPASLAHPVMMSRQHFQHMPPTSKPDLHQTLPRQSMDAVPKAPLTNLSGDWPQKSGQHPQFPPTPKPEQNPENVADQPQQSAQLQNNPISSKPLSKLEVLSPEGKIDLDSSYGEPELVINLDEGPSSTEGKENQYVHGSDTDDKSSSSPLPRVTRARKVKDYRAINAGTAQGPSQTRAPRSAGSPRGRATEGQSPKTGTANSPRTRSQDSSGSSPVVKLEKVDQGRTTRRSTSRSNAKEEPEEDALLSSDDWKTGKSPSHQEQQKPKDVYKFEDTEQEQKTQLIRELRSTRPTRKKKVLDNQNVDTPDKPPASPAPLPNALSQIPDARSREQTEPITPAVVEGAKSTPLSNMDAIIDAVSKGHFGGSEEDGNKDTPAADPGEFCSFSIRFILTFKPSQT